MRDDVESISISQFKATCLAVLERVRRTGRPVLVTRRGEPIAQVIPPSPGRRPVRWLGALRDRARIVGDVVSPVTELREWEPIEP